MSRSYGGLALPPADSKWGVCSSAVVLQVLIFSQMTSILDILMDYCYLRGFQYSRLDGSMAYADREENVSDGDLQLCRDPSFSSFMLLDDQLWQQSRSEGAARESELISRRSSPLLSSGR